MRPIRFVRIELASLGFLSLAALGLNQVPSEPKSVSRLYQTIHEGTFTVVDEPSSFSTDIVDQPVKTDIQTITLATSPDELQNRINAIKNDFSAYDNLSMEHSKMNGEEAVKYTYWLDSDNIPPDSVTVEFSTQPNALNLVEAKVTSTYRISKSELLIAKLTGHKVGKLKAPRYSMRASMGLQPADFIGVYPTY